MAPARRSCLERTVREDGMVPAGYSGTPLAKKLGIVEGSTVAVVAEPDDFRDLLAPVPDGVVLRTSLRGHVDVAVHFVTRRMDFEGRIETAGRAIFPREVSGSPGRSGRRRFRPT